MILSKKEKSPWEQGKILKLEKFAQYVEGMVIKEEWVFMR